MNLPAALQTEPSIEDRSEPARSTSSPTARHLCVPVLAGLLALTLLVAGCGGGGPSPAVANLGSPTTTATTPATASPAVGAASSGSSVGPALSPSAGGSGRFAIVGGGSHMAQFAACMRSHGEPDFPDPNARGVISVGSSSGIDPGSPQFQKAQQACQKDMPNGGTPTPAQQAQMRQQALAFSACMRSHGVPGFPDPQFLPGGGVSMRISASSGLDPQSGQFRAAQTACQSDLPGRRITARGPGTPVG